MTAKLIVFSGKIECGKDTAVEALEAHHGFKRAECKESLHNATMSLFGVSEDVYWDIYNDRKRKETPNTLFSVTVEASKKLDEEIGGLSYNSVLPKPNKFPLTIREAMIYTSEIVMKPMFGEDVFGKRRADKLKEGGIYVDASYGFQEELTPAIEKIGQENILGIRINGRGRNSADSRKPLPDGLLDNTVDVWNGEDVSLSAFLGEVETAINQFLE